MPADGATNRAPETGAFFQRDRTWHPPALTPGYKSSVLRSPQKALLSFDNTLSEITGPVFGHAMLGELDDDLIHNFAKAGESDRLIRPFATGQQSASPRSDRLPRLRQSVHANDDIHIQASENNDFTVKRLHGHRYRLHTSNSSKRRCA